WYPVSEMVAGCPYRIRPTDALASPITLQHVRVTEKEPWSLYQGGVLFTGTFQKTDETTAFSAFFTEDPYGIKMIDNGQQTTDNDAKWYDLSGKQMVNGKWVNDKSQRGIFVTKGRKIHR
ncbi:MAG: hypothetical protein IIW69_00145, partial [Bacteroidaceae bacterium]|nr:hypothetical protein [Bacteroidaceae bacterium]